MMRGISKQHVSGRAIASDEWMKDSLKGEETSLSQFVCPGYARVITGHGWFKDEIKYCLYANGMLPAQYSKNIVEFPRTRSDNNWVCEIEDSFLLLIAGAFLSGFT